MKLPIKYPIILLIGLISGFLLNDCQRKLPYEVKTETIFKTDTVFQIQRDTIFLTKVKHIYSRDTIIQIQDKPYSVPLQSFSEAFNVLHGNVTVSGEVAGKVTKMSVMTDFKLPTITNTITTKETVVKKPSGLFLTAGIDKQLTPFLGGTFIHDRYLLGLTTQSLTIGYRVGR